MDSEWRAEELRTLNQISWGSLAFLWCGIVGGVTGTQWLADLSMAAFHVFGPVLIYYAVRSFRWKYHG